jgi:hypothetical protein
MVTVRGRFAVKGSRVAGTKRVWPGRSFDVSYLRVRHIYGQPLNGALALGHILTKISETQLRY